jgi:hypothetical protein
MLYSSMQAALSKSYLWQGDNITYYPDYRVARVSESGDRISLLEAEELERIPVSEIKDLRSDKEKLVINFHPSIAHAIQDSFSMIAAWAEINPNSEVVILVRSMEGDLRATTFNTDIMDVAIEILQSLGLSVVLANSGSFFLVNKFTIITSINGSVLKSKNLYDAVERFLDVISPADPSANAKLYISRSKMKPRNFMFEDDHVNVLLDDKRVMDEDYLEEVFKEMGFEIVYAENYSSFKEQVSKLRTAKVVAGVTGAGLTNFMFTSSSVKNRTLIEIATPVVLPEVREDELSLANASYHPVYWEMANGLDAEYISFGALSDRNGKSIAERIRNSPMFEYLSNL